VCASQAYRGATGAGGTKQAAAANDDGQLGLPEDYLERGDDEEQRAERLRREEQEAEEDLDTLAFEVYLLLAGLVALAARYVVRAIQRPAPACFPAPSSSATSPHAFGGEQQSFWPPRHVSIQAPEQRLPLRNQWWTKLRRRAATCLCFERGCMVCWPRGMTLR
jgi:hypothetical protein